MKMVVLVKEKPDLLQVEKALIFAGFHLHNIGSFSENHPLFQIFCHQPFNEGHARHVVQTIGCNYTEIKDAVEALRQIYQKFHPLN